ncbi:MAG: leucine-rich repeat domain-containing protein [Treponema sp.]|nr:leucine-rich repeat domain-containing protein [Treponema sp.]
MKSHKFQFLLSCSFFTSLFFLLILSSCTGFNSVKTSGSLAFSFDARSILSSLEKSELSLEGLQELKIQIALLGDSTSEPQSISFTESELSSDALKKTAEFADIPTGSSVYARGIIYASIKENNSTFIYPVFYGTSDEITVNADSNPLPLTLTSLVSNNADYEWEASGVTSDGKREFMFLVFKSGESGTYILSEIGCSAVPSFGDYQAKSYDEKTGLPTEFQLTETVYQPAESNDYVIVQKPEAKSISVTDGKFSFTSASGLEVSFGGISENPEEPDLPDISELPASTYPYEIQFWIKNDGATGTADSDYSHQSLYDCTGSINLDETSDADALLNAELMKRVLNLFDLGYVSDEEKNALAEKDGTSLFLQDGKIIYRYYMKKESAVSEDPAYNGNGSIVIDNTAAKYILAKNSDESSAKFYLNNGKFTFSLLDENDNDVLADVKWDAYSETDGFLNQNLLNISYEITYKGHSVNSLSYDGFNYVQISSYNPLTKGGSYLLTLTVSPSVSKTTYVNKSGQTVDFPDFEPVSGIFEVEVEDVANYEFDASNLMTIVDPEYQTYGLSDDFLDFIDSLTSDSLIKISGTIPTPYGSAFQPIKNRLNGFIDGQSNEDKICKYLLDFDFSEMTTESTDKTACSCEFQNCKALRSIILPVDLTKIGYCTFSGCSNLEKIVFGSAIESIEDDTALSECSKLSSVVIPEDAPFEKVGSYTFKSDTLLKTLSLPASFKTLGSAALGSIETLNLADESGTWYYTKEQNVWFGWHSETQPQTPEITEGSVGELTSLKDFSNSNAEISYPADVTTVSQKLLYAAQHTDYYFYCVK